MFMEPMLLLFYSTCVVAFLCGVRFSRYFRLALPRGTERRVSTRSPFLYLSAPLLIAALCCSLSLIVLGGHLNFVALLVAQQGAAIKVAGETGEMKGIWGLSMPALTSILWWSLFRMNQLQLNGAAKALFYLIFFIGVGIGVLTSIATVDRTSLMPIILGLLVVYFFNKTRARNASVVKIVATGVMASIGAVAIFLLLSFLRGASALQVLISGLLGYTIVSYNRMSALLIGVMHYTYEGHGVYLSRFLVQNERLNLAHKFGWPDVFGLWQSEFSSTMAAGLNPSYIWSGAFGYIYSDIGWWSPVYVFAIGLLAGYLWRKLSEGKTVGLVVYPWIGYSILIWCGPNILFSSVFTRLGEVAMILWFYDRLFLRQEQSLAGIDTRKSVTADVMIPVADCVAGGAF
jgi:hypothetical protein